MNNGRSAPPLSVLLFAVALAAATAAASPVTAQTWESIPTNPKIDVAYLPPDSPEFEGIYNELKGRKILEELQHFLAPLHLPHPLRLLTRQCGIVNAWYSPSDRSITLCYEIVAEVIDKAPQTVSEDGFITRQAAIVGGVVGIVLHEGGHMLFDMLDVPVFGREEDAADETASFIAMQFNKDVERTIIKGFAYQWAMAKDPAASASMSVWSDEHGSASQRMYNTLCLAYGGDPLAFQEFVARGWLPKERADHCGEEFRQLKLAFMKTVLPFIDRDLMVLVRQTQWFTAEELK